MLDPPTQPARETTGAKGQIVVEDPTPAQRALARRTAEARATIPDFECSVDADVTAALARWQRPGCSLDGALMAACATGLRAVPRANAAYRDGRYELYSRVNVGFVVALEDSYVIPTIFDADQKTPEELSAEIERLTEAALARKLAPPAFSGATFTLWNAGGVGLARATAIINPPQAAALAVGVVREAPVIDGGELRAGQVMTLTLACDHRILYGARAGQFLGVVRAALTTGASQPGP